MTQVENGTIVNSTQSSSQSAATKHKFIYSGCLYLPADDVEGMYKWYERHFQVGSTREMDLYYEKTEVSGENCAYITMIDGEPYEMYFARLETDCIDALYEHVSQSEEIVLEPLHDDGFKGKSFCFQDPQGNKFQVWQDARTEPQPMKEDVRPLLRVAALYFPVSDPDATLKWYTEYVGVDTNDAGQPVMSSGLEFHFIKSMQSGRSLSFIGQTQNHSTTRGEVPSMSIVHVDVQGLDDMHKRMLADGQGVMDYIYNCGGCGRFFYLTDPDGNKLAIAEFQTELSRVNPNAEGFLRGFRGQYLYEDFDKKGDQNKFFDAVLNDDKYIRKIVQINNYKKLCEEDPVGLNEQIDNIKKFNLAHQDHALTVIYQEGKDYVRIV